MTLNPELSPEIDLLGVADTIATVAGSKASHANDEWRASPPGSQTASSNT